VSDKPVAPKVTEVTVAAVADKVPASPAPTPTDTGARKQDTPTPTPAAEPVTDATGLTLAADSSEQHVGGLATVGVTWDQSDTYAENAIASYVRTLVKGKWSGWEKLEYHDDHGPDSAAEEGGRRERNGTEPSVVGHVDGVQVRTFTKSGVAPKGLKLALIDPGADPVKKAAPAIDTGSDPAPAAPTGSAEPTAPAAPSATATGSADSASLSASSLAVAAKPQIYSRAQWGADERIRDQSAPAYGTVQTGFVHHTVNANDYTEAQVPALIRGIYAYHVQSRGWRDIGYNYLIDRFGRIWEGRYGGVDKAVVGAHTKGYNEVSFAASAIGNYDIAQPPPAVMTAFAQLFAWKLSLYGIPASQTGINVKGKILNAINGHRDVGQTACPGRYLYAQLPNIRAQATQIQGGAVVTPPPPPATTPTTPPAPSVPITPVPAEQLPARSSLVGDTWPDLVVREKGTNVIKVVPTGGQLGFGAPTTQGGTWKKDNVVVAAGDLTGDGVGDLFVRAKKSGRAAVRRGLGDGTFAAARRTSTAFSSYGWISAVGDLSSDGKADLLAGSHGSVYLFRGTGKGTFKKRVLVSSSWSKGRLVSVGDFTGDGRPDLSAVNKKHQVVLFQRTKAGLKKVGVLPVTAKTIANLVGGGDVTGDGVSDVVTRTAAGTTYVYVGNGAGSVGSVLGPFSTLAGVSRASLGQVTGSATAELTGVTGAGLSVIRSNGKTNVGTPVGSGYAMPGADQLLNLGDWDHDGIADLGSRTFDNGNLWFRKGDGHGGWGTKILMGNGFKGVTRLAAVGDVTGDGHPDLVGQSASGQMVVWPGNGTTGVGTPIAAPAALRTYNQIGSGLWNAAGGTGLASSDGSFVPYLGAGASLAGYDWVIGPGDVDGDGIADLLVRETSTGSLYLLPGTGSGGLGTRRFVAAGFANYDLGG
ncbi:MAG: N-acetylmuramoyl-L-alanine amidase, family 2, partial [Nocardioidaceae bacterium]|nr:N-acetylmuramoyl-L-alanine amidase, family 2 [Nocardioidaceae bacterium]